MEKVTKHGNIAYTVSYSVHIFLQEPTCRKFRPTARSLVIRCRGLHGNGDGGNTAVMGTTFTVIPRRRGHVSRGYRGDGEQRRR